MNYYFELSRGINALISARTQSAASWR